MERNEVELTSEPPKKRKIMGIIRHGLTFAGGILAAFGVVDGGAVELISSALVTLIGGVWSILDKDAEPMYPPLPEVSDERRAELLDEEY